MLVVNYYMSEGARLGRGYMVGQCCSCMSGARLVGGAWLVSVVSICRVCETLGRGMVCQCG